MNRPTRPISASALKWAGSVALLAVLVGLLGCSPEGRYQVLSFFFDGVPDPNAPPPVPEDDQTQVVTRSGQRVVVHLHEPFAQNNCNACHAGATGEFTSFQKVEPDVCLTCHGGVPMEFAVMHGPVAAGECLFCHEPHESPIAGLLKAPAPEVCTQCHEPQMLLPPPQAHLDPQADCLLCHVGHGGAEHGLLREGFALDAPPAATMPSPEAAP